jgi:large subunit ribosomal protein L9
MFSRKISSTLAALSSSTLRTQQHQQIRAGSSIKIILLENHEKKGAAGDIVEVKRGYARNFLIPRKIAAYATKENQTRYADLIGSNTSNKKNDSDSDSVDTTAEDEQTQRIKTLLAGGGMVFERAVSSGSVLYGSVTDLDVRSHMDSVGLGSSCVLVMEPSVLKALGKYSVTINGATIPLEIIEPALKPKA